MHIPYIIQSAADFLKQRLFKAECSAIGTMSCATNSAQPLVNGSLQSMCMSFVHQVSLNIFIKIKSSHNTVIVSTIQPVLLYEP